MKPHVFTRIRTASLLLPMAALAFSPLQAETLQERQQKVSAVVEKARPAVVGIMAGAGAGSGVIVSKDGLVLTAGHVLASGGDDIMIILPDGRQVKAKSLGRDMDRDAALAQITEPGDWPHVEMAEGKSVESGEWCVAMGHPGGFDLQRGAPVRLGRLWDKSEDSYYRSDCTVSGGDSGGPLFDLDGKVIGIHSSISTDVAENRHVPIDVYHKDMEKLKKGERWGDLGKLMPGMKNPQGEDEPRRGRGRGEDPAPGRLPPPSGARLGIQMDPGEGSGPIVAEVQDDSPAAKAGLQLEDIITGVEGKEGTPEADDVVKAVRSRKPGDKLKLKVRRGSEVKELEVTLGRPE